ncbi:uncharacterized protein LOC128191838 [Crassostrea angulata]|uniref:uncharacterized protein LOC128191838 n=1 Tax=Magallana angulata TaxID=2784310 RepID=UPI0005C35BD5|nr:uncharacterized protein LOC128191838 [Crassostrea angulata]|eukprot:XP_011447316.1 PREDICTED: uncharacterized protein LOC105342149 [Crassostrea gigas]
MFWSNKDPRITTSIVSTESTQGNQTLPPVGTGGSENEFESFVEHEIGGIVGLIFGLLFSAALILAAYISYRRHRARNEEYQRDMKVFLNSKRNAGVYMDTTVESSDPIVVTRNNKDAVYAALRQPDLYEQESDEEF